MDFVKNTFAVNFTAFFDFVFFVFGHDFLLKKNCFGPYIHIYKWYSYVIQTQKHIFIKSISSLFCLRSESKAGNVLCNLRTIQKQFAPYKL